MSVKKFLLLLLIAASLQVNAQTFTYTPEKPQAGQTITVTYTPGTQLTSTNKPVQLVYYTTKGNEIAAFDANLKKSGNNYVASIPTVDSNTLVMIKIFSGDQVDNNHQDGYTIPLYNGDNLKAGADLALAKFYTNYSSLVGIDANPQKALDYMDKAVADNPETKKDNLIYYLRLYKSVHKGDEGNKAVEEAIENKLKSGLKNEDDYEELSSLYSMNKLPQQSKFISEVLQEKFPDGKWHVYPELQKYMQEQDPSKKEAMWETISQKIASDSNWKFLQPNENMYKAALLNPYIKNKDWSGMEKAIEKYDISGAQLASVYNNTAWQMQEKDEDMQQALKMSEKAVDWAKQQMNSSTGKPVFYSESEWKKNKENTYGMYADTYAMIQYKLGNYKKALPYTTDAAIKYNNLQNADENNTYALVASKALSPKKYVPVLEKMVKEGKATSKIMDILKEQYAKKHGEKEAENYIAGLQKERMEQMLAELKKSMLTDEAPSFSLKDMHGNKVNVADLKGKVVVLDFWATWCGPCKASFPAMQKMVTKFKDDPSIKFLFVDTWENGNEKEKNAKEFIAKNKYDFHVLMDNDNKVVEQFKIEGIPTKFVIDKNGVIRFKSVGFSGSDDGLVQELSAMIDLAKGA